MPDQATPPSPADAAFAELHALRVDKNTRRTREALERGDVALASYYADRVLVLVGKAITEEPMP